ncbi:Glutamine amidotransferase type 1 [Penicillium occitanis (nom. inval.)]|nr:hypothetical protein PENOC_102590 [Penicillium occitanis (nom. inval.)]PCG96018.1 Glutamine amidotransferase type 1 [Penicillium occitanis (nom. inval.)]
MMRESFEHIFESIAPGSKLDFFNLLLSPNLPTLTEEPTYDLVILGGTTYPPKPGVAWMQNLKDFEHKLNSVYTKQKVMGICLGHQTLAILNGSIMGYSGEPELAVTDIPLTPAGQEFFSNLTINGRSSLRIHEFHQRYITSPPSGFKELAENCQILLSDDDRIITFQGHPEMSAALMEELLLSPTSKESGYTSAINSEEAKSALLKRANLDHDGIAIFKSIVDWVKRP